MHRDPGTGHSPALHGSHFTLFPFILYVPRLTLHLSPVTLHVSPVSPLRWTADRMDQLEHAARAGLRVALTRRGTEYVVVAVRMTTVQGRDAVVGRLPMTGEELTFKLDEIDSFQVIE